MAGPFVRSWRYLKALLTFTLDKHADPRVQINQAIEDTRNEHNKMIKQAAIIVGNRNQLSMQISRKSKEVQEIKHKIQAAINLSEKRGTTPEYAAELMATAEKLAIHLITAEKALENLKSLFNSAEEAAEQAKAAIEENALIYQQRVAEQNQLLAQYEQAKMQESLASSMENMAGIAGPKGNASLEDVRGKIEKRYAESLGRAEIAANSVGAKMHEVDRAAISAAASERLKEFRKEIGPA